MSFENFLCAQGECSVIKNVALLDSYTHTPPVHTFKSVQSQVPHTWNAITYAQASLLDYDDHKENCIKIILSSATMHKSIQH